jgi:hypothetical protein
MPEKEVDFNDPKFNRFWRSDGHDFKFDHTRNSDVTFDKFLRPDQYIAMDDLERYESARGTAGRGWSKFIAKYFTPPQNPWDYDDE